MSETVVISQLGQCESFDIDKLHELAKNYYDPDLWWGFCRANSFLWFCWAIISGIGIYFSAMDYLARSHDPSIFGLLGYLIAVLLLFGAFTRAVLTMVWWYEADYKWIQYRRAICRQFFFEPSLTIYVKTDRWIRVLPPEPKIFGFSGGAFSVRPGV